MPEQHWNPTDYVKNAAFVPAMGADLIEMLSLQEDETVLDLGCGDGALTLKLRPLCRRVVAVDNSADQIEAARAHGLDAHVMDGHALSFATPFDAVISNAALHWMTQPQKVLNGVWTALKPDGRFVAEMGGAGNVQSVVSAASAILAARGIDAASFNPWFFPSVDQYRGLLQQQGFDIKEIYLFERPTPLDCEMVDWLKLFTQSFAAALPSAEREAFYAEISAMVEPQLRQPDGPWVVDYVRLRFAARKVT